MNKLIHTTPPSALACWLGRSMAWTLACAAGFMPVIYWGSSISGGKNHKWLALCWLTAVQALAWNKGLSHFRSAYQQSNYPASGGLKTAAMVWLTLLLCLLVPAALFCVLVGLVLLSGS